MSTPKLFQAEYSPPTPTNTDPSYPAHLQALSDPLSPEKYATTPIYIWLSATPRIYPYCLTLSPKLIRVNRTYSPMAHWTKLTNGTCRLLTTVSFNQAANYMKDLSDELSMQGYIMFDYLVGQPLPAPTVRHDHVPHPSLPEIDPADPVILSHLNQLLQDRIRVTIQNTKNCAKYRTKPNQYLK